jgi:hypothetical protein
MTAKKTRKKTRGKHLATRIISAVAAALIVGGLSFVIWFVNDVLQETGVSSDPTAVTRGVNTDILEKIESREEERQKTRPSRDNVRNPFQTMPEAPPPPAPANPAPAAPPGGTEPPALSQ